MLSVALYIGVFWRVSAPEDLDKEQTFIAIIGLICHYEELKCAKLVVRLRERLRVGLRPRKTGNKLK